VRRDARQVELVRLRRVESRLAATTIHNRLTVGGADRITTAGSRAHPRQQPGLGARDGPTPGRD